MKIVLVDDEIMALEELKYNVEKVKPHAEIFAYDNYKDVIKFVQSTKVDVVMLDIQMPGMDGIILATKLIEIQKDINIIFVTAYSEYALSAMGVFCSGYLLKPYRMEAVAKQFENLRFPVSEETKGPKLQIRCFGNFDAYFEGKPIHFKRQKAKELLAYLVDRQGTSATIGEICAVLFENSNEEEKEKAALRIAWYELRTTLREYGVENILLHKKNSYAIDKNAIECDYYDYLEKNSDTQVSFIGRYMEQYSWAETTNAELHKNWD